LFSKGVKFYRIAPVGHYGLIKKTKKEADVQDKKQAGKAFASSRKIAKTSPFRIMLIFRKNFILQL